MNGDPRLRELQEWLAVIGIATDGPGGATISPASEDASFRRYFRLDTPAGSRIVMDAPPDREDSGPFVRIAGYLERIGVNAPRILAADVDRGFLLLTDLGSVPYLAELKQNPSRAPRLYADALRSLGRIQKQGREFQSELPSYDAALLSFELSLFRDWLCGRHLQLELRGADEAAWQTCCDRLVDNALQQPKVFVHRDYHSRNLMVTESNNPGILDFQDAVEGPVTYDLVSLLKDCYIKWPADQIHAWVLEFHSGLDPAVHDDMSQDDFIHSFGLMGVQRHLKAAGIFARLCHRDGKRSYLNDVPRTLQYIVDVAPHYDELSFLSRLISERVLPRLAERQ